MTGIYPFLRPDTNRDHSGELALYIDGTFPAGVPSLAYFGEVSVINPIGTFEILSITGDTLPPGSDVYVDNGANKIVIRWPAYSEHDADLPNGDFSTGNLDHWDVFHFHENPGFPGTASVSAARPPVGADYSGLWVGNSGTGHAGGVDAIWLNGTEAPMAQGRSLTASAQIALDDTDDSANRGDCRVTFYDSAGTTLREFRGNTIRGNNPNYQTSRVTGIAPANTAYARVGVWTTANADPGSGVRFGNVEWNAPEVVGINHNASFHIQICIRDAAGRVACTDQTLIVLSPEVRWYSRSPPSPTYGGLQVRATDFDGPVLYLNNGADVSDRQICWVDSEVVIWRADSVNDRLYCSFDGGHTAAFAATTPNIYLVGAVPHTIAMRKDHDFCLMAYPYESITGVTQKLDLSSGTFTPIVTPARVHSWAYVGSRVYAVMGAGGPGSNLNLYYSDDDGGTWNLMQSVVPASNYSVAAVLLADDEWVGVFVSGANDFRVLYFPVEDPSSIVSTNTAQENTSLGGGFVGGGVWAVHFSEWWVGPNPAGMVRKPGDFMYSGSGFVCSGYGNTLLTTQASGAITYSKDGGNTYATTPATGTATYGRIQVGALVSYPYL